MKNIAMIIAICALCGSAYASTVLDNRTDTVNTKAAGFIVEYNDGYKERYLASYIASIDVHRQEEGESSNTRLKWDKLLPEIRVHAIDNRKCRWKFRSYITRKMFMVNRAGEQFPKPGLEHVFENSQFGRGEGSNWTRWHEQTCGEAQSNFDAQHTDVKNRLSSAFGSTTNTDISKVKAELKSKLKDVKAITLAE